MELEQQLERRWEQVKNNALNPTQAFGKIEDWILQLGERKALLHPTLKQWMWFDRVHNEWVFAGCGVREAILLYFGDIGGIKKLPQPGNINEWCVYWQGNSLYGPLSYSKVAGWLSSNKISTNIKLWIPSATQWLIPVVSTEGGVSFTIGSNGEWL
jgi:hypothetical protein